MKFKVSIILVITIICGLTLVCFTKEETKTAYYNEQIEATNKTQEAFKAVKEKRLELGIDIKKNLDPLETGLIGDTQTIDSYSITTTLGILEAKRISTNPNFAALIVKYFKDLDLKENDEVAVNFSSSFPALNIATLVALDTLKLKSVIQTSIGSSTYGANIIDFTYLDMEKHLYDENIITRKSDLISLGGEKDILAGMRQNDEAFIASMYNRYIDYDQIKETNLQKNVNYRYKYYKNRLNNIKVFINVGGNLASHGAGFNNYTNGLVKFNSKPLNKNSGLIDYFVNDHVQIINLLNIEDLAKKNNLQTNVETVYYKVGIGKQYYETNYQTEIIIITLILVYTIMFYDLFRRNAIKLKEGVFFNEE